MDATRDAPRDNVEGSRPNPTPEGLLRLLEEEGITSWGQFRLPAEGLTENQVNELKRHYGELAGLAAQLYHYTLVSPVEKERDIRHGRLDRGAFPEVHAGDLETLYRRHDWFRDCQGRGNGADFRTFDSVSYAADWTILSVAQSKWVDTISTDNRLSEMTHQHGPHYRPLTTAVEGGVSVYYITPGGSRTQQRWVASFEDLGGIVIDKDHMNSWGEDYILYLKARLAEWQGQLDRFVVRQGPVAMVAPRGVQLAPLCRLWRKFEDGGVRCDLVLGTGAGKTNTAAALVSKGKKVVFFVDGQSMVRQTVLALRRSGLMPVDTVYSWMCSLSDGDLRSADCKKISVSRRTLAGNDRDLGQINIDECSRGIESFKAVMGSDKTQCVVCLYDSAPILLELVCFHACRRFDLAILDEVHVVSTNARSHKDACHFVGMNTVGLTATQELCHVGSLKERLDKQKRMVERVWLEGPENRLGLASEFLERMERNANEGWAVPRVDLLEAGQGPENVPFDVPATDTEVAHLPSEGDESDDEDLFDGMSVDDDLDDFMDDDDDDWDDDGDLDDDDDGEDASGDDDSVDHAEDASNPDDAGNVAPVDERVVVRGLSGLTEQNTSTVESRWRTAPSLSADQSRMIWLSFQAITCNASRERIGNLPACFMRCEGPPAGSVAGRDYFTLNPDHLLVPDKGEGSMGIFSALPLIDRQNPERVTASRGILWGEGSMEERVGAVGSREVYVRAWWDSNVWYRGSDETVETLFATEVTSLTAVANQPKGTLVLQDHRPDAHYLAKRLTRTCEFVCPQGQCVELGYTVPGKIVSFVVTRGSVEGYKRAIEQIYPFHFVRTDDDTLDVAHGTVVSICEEVDQIQQLPSDEEQNSELAALRDRRREDIRGILKQERVKLRRDTQALLRGVSEAGECPHVKEFWDRVREDFLSALDSQGVTGRVIHCVDELAMGIGVVDLVYRDGLKLMVKNSTVDKSNAAKELLRRLCKLMRNGDGEDGEDGEDAVRTVNNIHYQISQDEVERLVDGFRDSDGPGILGVVQKACQGTDIPPLSALLPWDRMFGKPPKEIERIVYSRANQQFMGRACRKFDGPPEKVEYKYIVPGIEVEDDEAFVSAADWNEGRALFIEHLKQLTGEQFGVYCTGSAFVKDTMGDPGVTFHLVRRRPPRREGGPSSPPAQQPGDLVDDRRRYDISSEEVEEIRRHIFLREHPNCLERGLALYRQTLHMALAEEVQGEEAVDSEHGASGGDET